MEDTQLNPNNLNQEISSHWLSQSLLHLQNICLFKYHQKILVRSKFHCRIFFSHKFFQFKGINTASHGTSFLVLFLFDEIISDLEKDKQLHVPLGEKEWDEKGDEDFKTIRKKQPQHNESQPLIKRNIEMAMNIFRLVSDFPGF